MAKYKSIVVTSSGLALVAATHDGGTIQFTAIKTGSGAYEDGEILESATDLKSVRQTFGISSITRENEVVKVVSILSNEDLTEGYYLTEIGLYALDKSTGKEILYAVVVAENEKGDYFTPYAEFPQSMTLELYITAVGVEEGVTFTASILNNVYVTVKDHQGHIENTDLHITPAERAKWNAKVDSNGTVANALNADKLDGLDSVKFLKPNFTTIAPNSDILATADDDVMCPPQAVTRFRFYTPTNAPLNDWDFFVEVEKVDFNWIKIRATTVRSNKEYAIVKSNGVWGTWTSKLDDSGGTINGNYVLSTSTQEERRVEVINSLHHGRLAVSAVGTFGLWDQSYEKWLVRAYKGGDVDYAEGTMNGNKVFHAGNSRPVVISSTVPTDTTALWIQ